MEWYFLWFEGQGVGCWDSVHTCLDVEVFCLIVGWCLASGLGQKACGIVVMGKCCLGFGNWHATRAHYARIGMLGEGCLSNGSLDGWLPGLGN